MIRNIVIIKNYYFDQNIIHKFNDKYNFIINF